MEVTKNDIIKHYLSSIFIYGIILILLFIIPVFNAEIHSKYLNYFSILLGYYILYVIFALPIFFKFRPKSILKSRSIVILNYFKRQFLKDSVENKLQNLYLTSTEKQVFVILFIKVFFGCYSLSLLCNKYLIQLGYNVDYIITMFRQSMLHTNNFISIWQFIDDTTDVWLTLMFTLTNIILAISYLTETEFLKNKIKYVDTSFLGIASCVMCYYPFVLLTEKIIPVSIKELMPIDNDFLRVAIYILALLVNIIVTLSVMVLGTKSGNLTNRGIVKSFPYNIVRHPEYSAKIGYIIISMLPVYISAGLNTLGNIILSIGVLMWIGLYILRAITEERNLIKDPEYKEYICKVKYRFIPFIF